MSPITPTYHITGDNRDEHQTSRRREPWKRESLSGHKGGALSAVGSIKGYW
jgi:hypothetical protein